MGVVEDVVEAEAHPSFVEGGPVTVASLPPGIFEACVFQGSERRHAGEVVHIAKDNRREIFHEEMVADKSGLLGATFLAFFVYIVVVWQRGDIAYLPDGISMTFAEVVGADQMTADQTNGLVVQQELEFVDECGEPIFLDPFTALDRITTV